MKKDPNKRYQFVLNASSDRSSMFMLRNATVFDLIRDCYVGRPWFGHHQSSVVYMAKLSEIKALQAVLTEMHDGEEDLVLVAMSWYDDVYDMTPSYGWKEFKGILEHAIQEAKERGAVE